MTCVFDDALKKIIMIRHVTVDTFSKFYIKRSIKFKKIVIISLQNKFFFIRRRLLQESFIFASCKKSLTNYFTILSIVNDESLL